MPVARYDDAGKVERGIPKQFSKTHLPQLLSLKITPSTCVWQKNLKIDQRGTLKRRRKRRKRRKRTATAESAAAAAAVVVCQCMNYGCNQNWQR